MNGNEYARFQVQRSTPGGEAAAVSQDRKPAPPAAPRAPSQGTWRPAGDGQASPRRCSVASALAGAWTAWLIRGQNLRADASWAAISVTDRPGWRGHQLDRVHLNYARSSCRCCVM